MRLNESTFGELYQINRTIWNIHMRQKETLPLAGGRFNLPPILFGNNLFFIVETPIPKANNLKVTIGVAELVSCNETQALETECTEACRSNYPAKRRVFIPVAQPVL